MRRYLIVTAAIFVLILGAHAARIVAEDRLADRA
jgi:hypothetical protein